MDGKAERNPSATAVVRRRWSTSEKQSIVAESAAPGSSVPIVAARHGVSTSQVYRWIRQHRQLDAPPGEESALLPVKLIRSGERARQQAIGERAGCLHLDVGTARLDVEGAADLHALRLVLDYLVG